ncbi:helix-turn-helix transcriptional regulator [Vacuolonema iberomarrocanum]|uniref:helix-turn-helix transcriptional regulator n=1 Tax=Vacuolonema iberomarrocanum TaxID=3454632 RepID=UPI0019E1171F|nr:helix-turn-helix transcriptional regulator [filamentous cyanobacterium LEGE 07170]
MKSISNIAALREHAGLTQRELALTVGVTETTIANWERGRSGLEWIERLIKLCDALDCELTDLIRTNATTAEAPEPTFAELRQMYQAGQLSNASAQKPVSQP